MNDFCNWERFSIATTPRIHWHEIRVISNVATLDHGRTKFCKGEDHFALDITVSVEPRYIVGIIALIDLLYDGRHPTRAYVGAVISV